MERPKKISGEQGKYIEYLEAKLDKLSARKTKVRSYLTLKKIVDDTNNIVARGLEIDDPNNPGSKTYVDVISQSALTDKDEKTFERIQKFIDKLLEYTRQVEALEVEITEEEIDHEKELLKGEMSVEGYIFGHG